MKGIIFIGILVIFFLTSTGTFINGCPLICKKYKFIMDCSRFCGFNFKTIPAKNRISRSIALVNEISNPYNYMDRNTFY